MTYDEACEAVCAQGTMFEITEADVRGVSTKVFAGTPPDITALFQLAACIVRAAELDVPCLVGFFRWAREMPSPRARWPKCNGEQ